MSNGSTVIRNVTENIATFSRPFSRFGIFPIGGRSTAIRLRGENGGVWLLASTPLDEQTKAKLNEMGPVKYVVAGDYEHSMFVKQYADAYPDAKVIGVDGLSEKNKDVKWTGEYGKSPIDTKYGFEDEIQSRYFATFNNKDMVFCHKDSKTLIAVDLLFNLPCNEQYKNAPGGKVNTWVPFYGSLAKKFSPESKTHQGFLWNTSAMHDLAPNEKTPGSSASTTEERRKRFAKDAEEVASWDFEKIIPCHGDVIENGGKQAWLSAFARFLTPDGKSKI
jgi:hypothetical protein